MNDDVFVEKVRNKSTENSYTLCVQHKNSL